MIRAGIGAAAGAAFGFVLGIGIGYPYVTLGRATLFDALMYGALVGAGAAATGAVIGGTGDILAHLRKAFPARGAGPEADYHDSPRPPT